MYTILVVDDEKDIVSALEIYLKAEGYRVLTAYNGREALSVAAREDVHLILMDIMMPVMDGLTAMAQLRQTSNVPVILLTAKGEDTDKVLGLNVGADDYITKPFNPVEMLAPGALPAAALSASGRRAGAALHSGHRRHLSGRQCQNRHRGRRHSVPHPQGIRHSPLSHAERRHGVFPQRDLPPGVGRYAPQRLRRHRRAHPPPAGEAGDRSLRSPVHQGRVGQGL